MKDASKLGLIKVKSDLDYKIATRYLFNYHRRIYILGWYHPAPIKSKNLILGICEG